MASAGGVVVVGSANVDLVTNAPRMAQPGETLMGTRFEQLFGGKGANQAVAAALLGSSVSMVAKLGTDNLGEATLGNFRSLGVDTEYVSTTAAAASGVAQITVDAKGQNVRLPLSIPRPPCLSAPHLRSARSPRSQWIESRLRRRS